MRTLRVFFLLLFLPTLVFATSHRVARLLPNNPDRTVCQGPVRDDPGRDRIEVISYENQDGLNNYLTMPDWTGFGDHSLNVRFTPDEAEFALIGLEVVLFDMGGNNGNPGMTVSIWSSDNDGYPDEDISSFNVGNDDLSFSSEDEIQWTEILFADHDQDNLRFENAENFHIVLNVNQEEDSDTLAIIMDDGEQQPTDRSGFFNGEWEVWDLIEIAYEVGYNLAIHAIVEYPDPDQPELVIEPMVIETDLLSGELEEFVINMANDGAGRLEWESAVEFIDQPGNPPDQPWVTWIPSMGEIEPGEDTDIIIALSAVGLRNGEYTAALHIFSNDPENPDIAVSIFLNVEGAVEQAPIIVVNPEEIDFGIVDIDQGIDPIPLEIANIGNERLDIHAITAIGDFFTDFEQGLTIEPDESVTINVGFAPQNAGVSEGSLIINSNDPNQSELSIHLRGELPAPPQIGIDPMFIYVFEEEQFDITITNAGGRNLIWTAACDAFWCDISPAEGTVPPDDSGILTLKIDTVGISGQFMQTQIVFASNDPEGTGVVVEVYYDDHGIGVEEEAVIPSTFSLNSIYPNPFNPSTTISFALPSEQLVTLKVFDANGRAVKSLLSGAFMPAGNHEISFDGHGLPAGNYNVHLQAGDSFEMRGMSLVK